MKAVLTQCKKVAQCPYCGKENGTVKKSGPLKISHEPYRSTKNKDLKEQAQKKFSTVVGANQNLAAGLEKMQQDLNPLKVLELFKRISAEVSCKRDTKDVTR
jgi:DNA-directed RNA polymerase III subunit RPC1